MIKSSYVIIIASVLLLLFVIIGGFVYSVLENTATLDGITFTTMTVLTIGGKQPVTVSGKVFSIIFGTITATCYLCFIVYLVDKLLPKR